MICLEFEGSFCNSFMLLIIPDDSPNTTFGKVLDQSNFPVANSTLMKALILEEANVS